MEVKLIILDIGACNVSKGSIKYYIELIDKIYTIYNNVVLDEEIIIKAQLFKKAGDNIPMKKNLFESIYRYCAKSGFKCTASVFDLESLNYLLSFNIPFVKIPCNKDLYYLSDFVPNWIPIFKSHDYRHYITDETRAEIRMVCIPEYPAHISEYEVIGGLRDYVSDHTEGIELHEKYRPKVWEKHIVLHREKGNIDCGEFAILPEDLKEIL